MRNCNFGILFWKVMGQFHWETSSLFLGTRYSFCADLFLKAMQTHRKTTGLLRECAISSKEKNGKGFFLSSTWRMFDVHLIFSKLILLFAFSVVGKSSQHILPNGWFHGFFSYGTIRKKSKSSIFGGPIILTYSHTPPLNMTKTILSHSWIVIWVLPMVLPIANNSPLKIGQAPQRPSIPNHQFVGLLGCSAGG